MDTRWTLLITLTVVAVAVSGCTTSTPTASPTAQVTSPTAPAATPAASASTPTAQASLTASVVIKDFSFKPDVVTVARGGTVTWTNEDATTHTVKFADGESPGLQKGGTNSKNFDTTGSFDYSCGIHPSMHGTVKVV